MSNFRLLLPLLCWGALAFQPASSASDTSTQWKNAVDAGIEAYKAGQYAKAESTLLRSLKLAQSQSDDAFSTLWLTKTYYAEKNYHAAELVLEQRLARQKRAGATDQAMRDTIWQLAGVCKKEGKPAKAEQLEKRVKDISNAEALQREAQIQEDLARLRSQPNPDSTAIEGTLQQLAFTYDRDGKYAQAEAMQRESLAMLEKEVDPNHFWIANRLLVLAKFCNDQHKYSESESCYKRALSINEKWWGQDSFRLAGCLTDYALLLKKMNRDAEAAQLQERIRALRPAPPAVGEVLY